MKHMGKKETLSRRGFDGEQHSKSGGKFDQT